jgi:hypothetical protein
MLVQQETPVTALNSINQLMGEMEKWREWSVRGKNWIFKLVVQRNKVSFNTQSVFRLSFLHRTQSSANEH